MTWDPIPVYCPSWVVRERKEEEEEEEEEEEKKGEKGEREKREKKESHLTSLEAKRGAETGRRTAKSL